MQEPPVPDPGRSHDVSGLTDAELQRARRELQASLALARPGPARPGPARPGPARPGSAASVPILAHLSAIDTELAGRSAATGKPPGLGTRAPAGALTRASVQLTQVGPDD